MRAYHDLVQEVLDELFLEGPRGQQTMQIGTEEFCDKVAGRGQRNSRLAVATHTDLPGER